MHRRSIEIYPDPRALSHAAAGRTVSILEERLAGNGFATLVLTGGRTPKPVYELLASQAYVDQVDWDRIHFFWGDERCVPPEDPESNFGMAWSAFVSKIRPPAGNIHRMRGGMGDPAAAASLYEAEIRDILPGIDIPSFDLVLLGMGADGHTASLFPGTSWEDEKLVVSTQAPDSGIRRISMTPRLLNSATAVLFLVTGANKAETLVRVLRDPAGDLPASKIDPVHGSLTWMVDEAAGRLVRDLRPA